MSYTGHDATRQYLGISGVSPVGSIRDCRIPSYPPLMRLPARTLPVAPFFLRPAQNKPRAAMDTGSP
jgi:hypothetical protein